MASADYISREAFAAEMKERQTEAGKWLREAKDHDTAVRADAVLSFLCEVKLTLDKISAADVRPVVRGTWIWKDNGEVVCSECNDLIGIVGNIEDLETVISGFNFCPNCGADMREES